MCARALTTNSFFSSSSSLFYFIHLIVVVTSAYNNSNTSPELVQRYKQSIASSNCAYHSTETINEALSPPWALDYEVKRRVATPNPPSNTTDSMSNKFILIFDIQYFISYNVRKT